MTRAHACAAACDPRSDPIRICVISDTHGLLRPEVITALRGADYIFHAGDVGDPAILDALKALAPLTAIRGNIDTTGACAALPANEAVELGDCFFYLVHSVHDLDLHPEPAGIGCVVSGHSHKPTSERRGNVLYLNPGSCGPRRFSLPVSMAVVGLEGGKLDVQLLTLASGRFSPDAI